MRDLIVTQNITVDGVIDAAEGWFGPGAVEDVDVSDHLEANRRQREAADAFLVGRRTFEDMRSYWPDRQDDETGISSYLDGVQKYVVSTTLRDPGWGPTTILDGPLEDEVRALKDAPGADIVVTGSIRLTHALIAFGLVDEFRLFTFPVVVGRGARLFEDPSGAGRLRLVETEGFRSGIVLTRYRTDAG